MIFQIIGCIAMLYTGHHLNAPEWATCFVSVVVGELIGILVSANEILKELKRGRGA